MLYSILYRKYFQRDFIVNSQGSGAMSGLTVVLKAKKDDLDYVCRGPVQGFKVYIFLDEYFGLFREI